MKEQQSAVRSAISGQPYGSILSDAELLGRFVACRDESAFAALVVRHGPMVFGVCRRLLHHAQDAEDAFQATFLILVRKAAAISRRELLANWLYGVATRVAARARILAARRQVREGTDMEQVAVATREPAESRDLSAALEEEVQRLPAKYRSPFVLCYLEGHTNEEAAGELRCPIGTVKTRLARAREMLRKRLLRRGLALSTGTIATAFSLEAPAAALIDSTLKAAMDFAAGDAAAVGLVSAQAATLTKGVLHTMFVTKMKTLAALVLALAVVVGGAGGFAYHLLATEADAKKTDRQNIQGTWEVVSLTTDKGIGVQETMLLENAAWVFEKDKFLLKGQIAMKDVTLEGPYKINPAKTPRTIDITMKRPGADEERKIEGIYKLNSDELTICFPGARKMERPTEFVRKEGSNTILVVLKREKK